MRRTSRFYGGRPAELVHDRQRDLGFRVCGLCVGGVGPQVTWMFRITSFQGNPVREPPREVHAPVEGHRGPSRPIEAH